MAWSCSGNQLASGSVDQHAFVWSLDSSRGMVKTLDLSGHTDGVDHCRWAFDQEHVLATASRDKTLRLWDVRGELDPVSILIAK